MPRTLLALTIRSLTAVLMICCDWAFADIIIDNYSSATNDRFQNSDVPDQFFVSSDLSGVGQDASGRWATLIGPNTIISANHLAPSGTVSFYPDNLATSIRIDIPISVDVQRIGNTDLWLARLEQYAPTTIRVFDYARQQITAPTAPVGPGSNFPFKGANVVMTGRSPASFPAAQDQAYGTNVISGFVEDDTSAGLGSVDAFRLDYNTGGTPFEAFLQSGDSGAPLFTADGNGQLLLLGVNSYTSSTLTGTPVASFVSYIGNDSSSVDSLVSQWAAVPEPNCLFWGPASALLFSLQRRRRS